MKLCSIEGCERPHKSKGFCGPHAERVRKYGTAMPNQPVFGQGAPGAFYAQLLDTDTDDCIFWPFARHSKGYGQMGHLGKTVYVHRRLCHEVHGPQPTGKHEVAHGCGKGHLGCVNPRHLRWALHGENIMDRLSHGTHNRGAAHPMAKLTVSKVRRIRAMKGTHSYRAIAEIVGAKEGTVYSVLIGASWAWVDAECAQ